MKPWIIAFLLGCMLTLSACWSPCDPGVLSVFLPRPIGRWDGHTGRTPDEAVIISNLKPDMDLDITEMAWAYRKFGDRCVLTDEKAMNYKGRLLQEITCWREGQASVTIYFDVTNASEAQRLRSRAERNAKTGA